MTSNWGDGDGIHLLINAQSQDRRNFGGLASIAKQLWLGDPTLALVSLHEMDSIDGK
ncbi:MAG: hypothetical protein KAS36_02270 [Anaerolineales bacterium]|nr:hypothetical protein [Anaerolineales bacterium]